MSSAAPSSFETFARETLGRGEPGWNPYPWQVRFAESWANHDGDPPGWVIAPTGSGKTGVLDALVWALTQQADLAPAERTTSTRIVWAIDRRILVDAVFEHARALADRLDDALDAGPGGDPLHETALRLYRLACTEETAEVPPREHRRRLGLRPLAVQRWRGGIASREQLFSPFQPQIITSTVAQIGSRLLFRGYGVGERSLQLAAGLAAADTTVCLDEAHLASPFRETIEAIGKLRRLGEFELPPLRLVTLTATPPEAARPARAITAEQSDYARLGKRWSGEKKLELREPEEGSERALVDAVEELLGDGGKLVACVVNSVRAARRVHGSLARRLDKVATVALLVGPQRPAEREEELARIGGPLLEGKEPDRPLVAVATQTIEVGLDADFDAMVTQSASASALVQRLGRLNRSGNRPGRCIVIRDTASILYEGDEARAWEWLSSRPGAPTAIDGSVKAIAEDRDRPADLRPPLAATLTDAVVAQLSQTSPRPAPFADPDIEPLLKGIGTEIRNDVQLLWRQDLRFSLDENPDERDDLVAYRRALLQLAPPEPRELLTLPIGTARRLLATWLDDPVRAAEHNPPTVDDADLDGGEELAKGRLPTPALAHFVVVRGRQLLHGAPRRDEGGTTITLGEIAPGDTIAVPTSIAGVDSQPIPGPNRQFTRDVMADRAEPSESALAGEPRIALRLSWEALAPSPWRDARSHDATAKVERSLQLWTRIASALDVREQEDLEAGRGNLHLLPPSWLWDRFGPATERAAPALAAWLRLLADTETTLRLRRASHSPSAESRESLSDEESAEPVDETTEEPAEPDAPGNTRPDSPSERAARLLRVDPIFGATWVLNPASPRETGSDDSEETRPAPTLADHCLAVSERAAGFGRRLRLPQPVQQALELAGLAHDIGKCDPRFQDFLAEGSATPGTEPLAKSVFGTENPAVARLARARAELPHGFRHEALSAAILAIALRAASVPTELAGADPELAIALVGGSHGFGAPLWPRENGGAPAIEFTASLHGIEARIVGANSVAWLDGQWLQQFFDLRDRFGHWDLAYLQALVAVADRTVSREGG